MHFCENMQMFKPNVGRFVQLVCSPSQIDCMQYTTSTQIMQNVEHLSPSMAAIVPKRQTGRGHWIIFSQWVGIKITCVCCLCVLKFSSVLKDLVLGVWTVPQQVMNACKLWLLEQQPWIICHVWFETTLLPLSHSGFPVRFNSVTASSVNNITPKLEQLNIIQPSLTVCVGFLGLFFSTRIFPFVSHYKNNYNNYFW